MSFDLRAKQLALCVIGCVLSLSLLATGLPMRNMSPVGQATTLSFLVLNPPFIAVQFVAPHEAHELEHSSWPQWRYPTAMAVSLLWWGAVFYGLRLRTNRRSKKQGVAHAENL
jgi:hypothetical protein